jgi:hypothetical protein
VTVPKLSKLVAVDVGKVWPVEATSFTPWLLNNAEVLGEALGMDLLLEAAEHKVDGFSLDLIGRDQDTDGGVIIENQFGPTDHRHLGQLLTYAGGTTPATVVWIAESIRDEHRAAFDWLNIRTDSDTRFFGVPLGAVTLAGTPSGLVAPLLEVGVKPNEWGKQVRGEPCRRTENGFVRNSGQLGCSASPTEAGPIVRHLRPTGCTCRSAADPVVCMSRRDAYRCGRLGRSTDSAPGCVP